MGIRNILVILISHFLVACTTTTVTLVPDEGGTVGEVELINEGGATVLNKPYEIAKAKDEQQAPAKLGQISEENVQDKYADILAKQPLTPEHFLIYFKTGKSNLLPETAEVLAKIKATAEARKSCDLSVIGHADRVRDNDFNEILSMVRAENVANALKELGITGQCLDIRYYGENHPVIPTEDEIDEPRNRRVEVQIR